jgi:hypothetical protein
MGHTMVKDSAGRKAAPSVILKRLILVGGPPRSGTTLLARLLNAHPEITVAADNTVYESWSLYYYRTRRGLVQELREGSLAPVQAQQRVLEYLVKEGEVWGIAASPKVARYPLALEPVRPGSDEPMPRGLFWRTRRWLGRLGERKEPDLHGLVRHRVPLSSYRDKLRLCLKSPEIVFVLKELASAFPRANIVLVHRPIAEIAESMYRKGFEWRLASYHRRWRQELDDHGQPTPPPGVPEEWHGLWPAASDFQRCVIYAASYLRAMVLAVPKLAEPVFVYNHVQLRKKPSSVLEPLAKFLGIDASGWREAIGIIRSESPEIPANLKAEYDSIAPVLAIQAWADKVADLATKG